MPERVNVRVNNVAIQGLFENYGQIGRFGVRTTHAAVGIAREIVGKRTGRLAASIRGNPAAGKLHYTISLGSRNEAAAWVENGTYGPILPRRSPTLAVGKREDRGPWHRLWVEGQAAQEYLRGGAERALAAEGIFVRVTRRV